jgi:hypothetical protein
MPLYVVWIWERGRNGKKYWHTLEVEAESGRKAKRQVAERAPAVSAALGIGWSWAKVPNEMVARLKAGETRPPPPPLSHRQIVRQQCIKARTVYAQHVGRPPERFLSFFPSWIDEFGFERLCDIFVRVGATLKFVPVNERFGKVRRALREERSHQERAA